MQKRRLLMLLACLGIVGAISLGFWFWPQPTVIDRADFEKIQKGMTREEVTAILQVPPGDYTGGRPIAMIIEEPHPYGDDEAQFSTLKNEVISRFWSDARTKDGGRRVFGWVTCSGIYSVTFDDTGRAWNIYSMPVRPVPESPWQMVRRWFRNWV